MSNKNIKNVLLLFCILLTPQFLQAQTTQWRVIWDKNPSADSLAYYVIYRQIGSIPTLNDSIGMRPEPANQTEQLVVYTDNGLQTGYQYFYRIQAIDYKQRRSALSNLISESIPKIMIDRLTLQINSTTQYDLDDPQFVYYPGYATTGLKWAVSGGSQLSIQVNPSTNVVTIQTPSDSTIEETVLFAVENPNGFGDSKSVTISLTGGPPPPLPPPPPPPTSENMVVSVEAKAYGSRIVDIHWQTKTETKDYLQYGVNTMFNEVSLKDTDYSTGHKITLSQLIPKTTYQYRIISENLSGSVYTSDTHTFIAGEAEVINVFPIPYNMNNPPEYGGIYFDIPSNDQTYTLKIYTAIGDLVYSVSDLRQSYIWKVQNASEREVNAGLYLYYISGSVTDKVASGKLVIIR